MQAKQIKEYNKNNNKNNNKNKIILIISMITIAIIIFIVLYYNFLKTGNTSINKNQEQIVQDILNTSAYTATMEVEIITNKNSNKYKIKQELTNQGTSIQEVLEPENIAGVITKYENNKLTVENTKLNLTKIYENYQYLVDNQLWLDSFIKEYKEKNGIIESQIQEQNQNITQSQNQTKKQSIQLQQNQIILKVRNTQNNKYSQEKKLYINVQTGKPTKLIVQDINQNTLVYILYSEIEISY